MECVAFRGWVLLQLFFLPVIWENPKKKENPESYWENNVQVAFDDKDKGTATYMTTRVDVTAGGERVDKALPGFSSRALVPVKILPLPDEALLPTALCTVAISPATSEEGSRIERQTKGLITTLHEQKVVTQENKIMWYN